MPGSALEKIYYRLPVVLQNCIFSLYGVNLSRKRYNHFFYEHLNQLKKSEWWSQQKIKDYQDNKIRKIVNHAYKTVPFYHKLYDEYGVDINSVNTAEDLQKLPILTKDIVRANQHKMVSSIFSKKYLIKGLTSGTTGTPLTIYQTPQGLAHQWAIWWRHKARFGLHIGDRHLTFGARVPISAGQKTPPYWRRDIFNHRDYLSTYHISKDTVSDIVTYLNSNKFDFFTGYPSAIYELASLIDGAGLKIFNRPKHVVTGADALLPDYEELICRVFGSPVTEQYGMAEFAGNLAKCEHGLFHLDFECCHVEPMPVENNDFCKLIFTGWGNLAMPFIRYEVGDYATPLNGTCSCGRLSLCFKNIGGRIEDYIIAPDGRKLIGMNQVFEYAPNAKEIQLYQDTKNSVEFRVVASEGFGEADKNALIREFTRRCGSGIKIKFKIVDSLKRSSTGKLKAVISEIGQVGKRE